jgi:ubiquinone/menaquinone biosynthesis C-methylase UbiE
LPLAAAGYEVHLADPVPRHIAQALEASAGQPGHPLASARAGDARRIDESDASFDAVLMLGPLYHLTSASDRLRALTEARRVLRPGGVLLAAAISRFASLLDGLSRGRLSDPAFVAIVEADLCDGVHVNADGRLEWFTTAYFHRPEELRDEVAAAGFAVTAVVGLEGPLWLLPGAPEDDTPLAAATRQRCLDLTARVESEPSLLGMSAHLLAIGRKPA